MKVLSWHQKALTKMQLQMSLLMKPKSGFEKHSLCTFLNKRFNAVNRIAVSLLSIIPVSHGYKPISI